MPNSTADRVLEMFSDSKKGLEAKTLYNGDRGKVTEYTESGETVAFRFEYADGRIEVKPVTHDYTRDLEGQNEAHRGDNG